MEQAGLEATIDSAGNVRGRLMSASPNAKSLVVGSHFDTIENSGKYNGVLGILVGIAGRHLLTASSFSCLLIWKYWDLVKVKV